MAIEVRREVLADMLRQHGEDALAERALSLSDDELARIGTLGAYYAWSEDTLALGGSMGGARALSLATIDVLEDTGRDLRYSRAEWEREESPVDRFADEDAVRDRELRRHAAERQIPADKSKVTLDTVDPPAWGPAPPGATALVKRCHELRSKPLVDFTVEDLRLLIGQQVGLNRLVGLAHRRLRADALVEYDDYPTDLLVSLLRVDSAYWERSPDYDQELHNLAQGARERFTLAPELRELIETFNRDHSARRMALRARLASGTPDEWWSWPIQQRT
ncbi:MAG: contact-dependent growth inhibition system immunity protein [Solirubrobacteraceae bacterium]